MALRPKRRRARRSGSLEGVSETIEVMKLHLQGFAVAESRENVLSCH